MNAKEAVIQHLEGLKKSGHIYDSHLFFHEEDKKVLSLKIIFIYNQKKLPVRTLIDLDPGKNKIFPTSFLVYKNDPFDRFQFGLYIERVKQTRIKGYQNEQRAIVVANRLKSSDTCGIKQVFSGDRYEDKMLKVDMKIIVEVNTQSEMRRFIIPIQCKSSYRGQDIHMEKHPYVPSMVILEKMEDKEIEVAFIRIIKAWLFNEGANLLLDQINGSHINLKKGLTKLVQKNKLKFHQ